MIVVQSASLWQILVGVLQLAPAVQTKASPAPTWVSPWHVPLLHKIVVTQASAPAVQVVGGAVVLVVVVVG